MPERKQARTMDLPEYPCPPSLGDIASHAGSWGWANPIGVIAQDDDGYLWVNAATDLTPHRSTSLYVLAVWTEDGISVYVPRSAYQHVKTIRGAMNQKAWVPVASVMKEPPAYAVNFSTDQ
ncbi:hypothetical protein [Streptomyces sp. NPDC059916]|uniref:hypothetical protein n=1 Tax=Streptomyces sp. NPDC059916 TaxID=3347001 RepID=UPI0036CD4FA2